jgi:nitroreductase
MIVTDKPATASHPIHPLIQNRWSPRVFQQKPVAEEELFQLFEAARWAASSNNEQPWRFIYAYNGTAEFQKMLDCLSEFNQTWAGLASVLILTAIKEKFDSGKENYHALHDLGLAMGNFSVQAQSMGIGVHQMAGVTWQKAHEMFQVPAGYHVATAVAVGYFGGDTDQLPEDLASKENNPRSRRALEEIVFEHTWGQPASAAVPK